MVDISSHAGEVHDLVKLFFIGFIEVDDKHCSCSGRNSYNCLLLNFHSFKAFSGAATAPFVLISSTEEIKPMVQRNG